MAQKAASSSTNIEAEIKGEISGQIIVGNHNVQIHAEHGALVNVISGDNLPVPRARPTPVLSLRPRRFRGLLDRQTEVESVTSAFVSEGPVEIHGEAGIGKTSMLRHLAYEPAVDRFSAGVVYKSAHREPPADLLQFLFDAFYESDVPFKPTDTQVRHLLQDKQALVLLDDIELTREQFDALMDAVPSCSFVVASTERRLWGEVRSIAVPGLPGEDALALVERELGRPLTSEEREGALALCSAVKCNPLRILQEVAAARDERRAWLPPAQSAQAAPPPDKVTEPALDSLSESQRSILGVLAAFGGASVHGEHLAALSALPDSEPVVQTLQQRRLVQAEGSRLHLAGNLAVILNQTWDLTPWRESALAYFITWAEEHRHLPESLLGEADCVRALLEWAGATGRWRDAQRLGRAMEGALTLSGRWDAWRSVVQSVLQASRALGDQAGAGWAFHQLGTRALCLTEESDARSYLSQAIDIRESLGDRLGAAVSRHNLEILVGPSAPTDDSNGSSQPDFWRTGQVPLLLKLAGSALLVGLAGLGLWNWLGGGATPGALVLSAAVASHAQADLSWADISDNEKEFRIERRKGESVFIEVIRLPANTTSFTDRGLDANTSYTYRLRAAGPGGESGYSNETPVLTLPAPPSALLVRELSPIEIEIAWTDNSPRPSDFKVERSSDGGGTYSLLATIPAGTTTYSDKAITAADFYYRVRGTNKSGDSGPSNVEFWTASKKQKPDAPTLNKAEPASSTQVNLQWTDGSNNETGFKIERKAGRGSYSQIALAEPNTTSYEDRGLTEATSYSYRMRATNDAGDSAYTNEVAAATPLAVPAPPSDLAARPDTDGRLDLAWRDNSTNETGFHIERKISGDSYQLIKTMPAGAVRFADSDLDPQTNYSYRVQAFNQAGGSAFSNEASITTPALPGRIEVSLTPVRFGPVTADSTATAERSIQNIGKGTLDISVGTSGSPFRVLFPQDGRSLGPESGVLPVKVEFAPTDSGEFSGTLTIKSNDPQRPEVQIRLIGTGKRERVPVQLLSMTLASPVAGGESSQGTVTLSGVAPDGGAAITLSSNSQVVGVPKAVVVGAGETSAVFTIKTQRVPRNTRASITALLGVSKTEVLEVKAGREPTQPVKLESLTLASPVVTGGESSNGKVTLSGAAPAGGAAIALSSSTQAVKVPNSVVVRGGESSGVFTFKTERVTRNTQSTIWASLGNERIPAALELKAGREPQQPEVRLESLTLASSVLTGGEASDGKVRLNRVAPEGGAAINLSASSDDVVVPPDILVRGGETSAVFRFRTVKVAGNRRVTIWASLGQVRRPAVLELKPGREPTQPVVRLESLTLQPIRVKGGQRSVGTVTLSGKATRDIRVAISNSKPGVATAPKSVTVKVGSAVATFTIATIARVGGVAGNRPPPQSEAVQVTITASLDGKSLPKTLTVW